MEVAAYSLSEVVKALQASNCSTLHACENHIGDQGCDQVAIALAENSSVTTLRLNDNSIGDLGASLLAEALQNNQRMLTLSITRNQIGASGAANFAALLMANAHLTQLDLGQNSLSDQGVISLAEGLAANRRLISLDLQCNRISSDGAAALAGPISHGIPLRDLHLRDNLIDDAGAESLAGALKFSNLRLLDLSFNQIYLEGLIHLTEGVEASSTLTCLSLQHLARDRRRLDLTRLDAALQKNKQTMVVTVNTVSHLGKLHVSCTNMSSRSILEMEAQDISLQELYILVAEAVGQPSELRLIDAAGQLLPDSPDFLSEYL